MASVNETSKMSPQQYCLRWKYHNNNIQNTFSQLLDKGSFCDVTMWCGNTPMRAHRAVLASCSDLLFSLLAQHEYSLGEPSIVLDKIEPKQLSQLLVFMYTGEVNVHLNELQTFLKIAEGLGVKGLVDASWKDSKNESEKQTSPGLKQIPELKPEELMKPMIPDSSMKVPKQQMLSLLSNGSVPVKPFIPEPVKRKRGRPPLDPRPILDCEVIVPDDYVKKPKIVSTPNILRKCKPGKNNEFSSEVPADWNLPSTASIKFENGEEMYSECSEASLEGQDISQFLDTTIEEQPESENQYENKQNTSSDHKYPHDLHFSDVASPSDAPTITPETHPQFADVIKLPDYLVRGRRPQFWAEDYVKRVMEAVFCKELEMKQAAELLGVSYGTLYGRYRDCFGCINRPYRVQDFWSEPGPSEILGKIQRKEISITKAAEMLNVTQLCLTNYLNALNTPMAKEIEFVDPKKLIIPTNSKKSMISSEDEDDIITIKETNGKQVKATPSEIKDIVENVSLTKIVTDDKPVPSKSTNEESEDPKLTKKMPTIRVANMKFLTGHSGDNILSDTTNSSSQLMRTHPDLTILSKTKKVTFQEIATSLAKQQQTRDNQKLADSAGKVT